MKLYRLMSCWMILLAVGAGQGVAAQEPVLTSAQSVSLIQDLLARSADPQVIVDTLIEANVSLADMLSQLALLANTSSAEETIDALVEMGMSLDDAVAN